MLPDGPERQALMRDAMRTMLAYVPYIAHNHPYSTDLMHARVRGHRSDLFTAHKWRYAGVA